MPALEKLIGNLSAYPELKLGRVGNRLEIETGGPDGFPVSFFEEPGGFTVYLGSCHWHFGDEKEALEHALFGLSDRCRLREVSRGKPYRWIVEQLTDKGWSPMNETGLLFPVLEKARGAGVPQFRRKLVIMGLMPFEKLVLRSELPAEALRERLRPKVRKPHGRFYNMVRDDGPPYQGTVGEGFSIQRVVMARNSFLPHIEGRFLEEAGGTRITVEMRMARPIQVFMFFWLGGLGLFCLLEVLNWFASGLPKPGDLVPFGMLAFGYGIVMLGFKPESAKAKVFLSEIFEAESA